MPPYLPYLLLALGGLTLLFSALAFVFAVKAGKSTNSGGVKPDDDRLSSLSSRMDSLVSAQKDLTASTEKQIREGFLSFGGDMRSQQAESQKATLETLVKMQEQLHAISNELNKTLNENLEKIRRENGDKLGEIEKSVNEKLESTLKTRLEEQFRTVSENLAQMQKGLGEMTAVASSVGDLKKLLGNVKTRGVAGETQLAAILGEILKEHTEYELQAAVTKRSQERVDAAVILPGADEGDEPVLLPIDSKFPGDTYMNLLEAYDSGSPDEIEKAKKTLALTLKNEARSIRDKYIKPPHTTSFAILFLPFEGLYAEVTRSGLVDELRTEYSVNVAGPSTLAALLNSLKMGFQTLKLQKDTEKIRVILGRAKKSFAEFEKTIDDVRKSIEKADESLDKLVGVKTRAINKALSSVEADEVGIGESGDPAESAESNALPEEF